MERTSRTGRPRSTTGTGSTTTPVTTLRRTTAYAGLGVPGSSERIFDAEWELYDLRTDPEELVNVADDPAYAETRAALTDQLAELQRHYLDTPYTGSSTPHPVWPWS